MYNLIFNHNRDYDINTVKNQLIKWIETTREKNVLDDYYLLNTKNYTTNKRKEI